MNSLDEVKAVIGQLPRSDQEKLFNFLLTELEPGAGTLPPPREFSKEQIEKWIAADEAEWAKIKSAM